MKKLFLIALVVLSAFHLFSNVAPTSKAIITELYFDENDDWTIELYFQYFDAIEDTGYLLITATDTAHFWKFPDSTDIVLLTQDDLSKPVMIKRAGGMVWCENWVIFEGWELSAPFVYGIHPSANVKAPYSGQSLVSLGGSGIYWDHRMVKDTASSIGFLREPPKGIMKGHIYDSLGVPLPYIRVQTFGVEPKILWPDENGFFTDTLYAKDYAIWVWNNNPNKLYGGGFSIEPDSTTIHDIYLPVSSKIDFSGSCLLTGASDNSGIKIILTPECPFAPNDTLLTNAEGEFSGEIKVGHYMFRYSNPNYLPYSTFLPLDIFYGYNAGEETLLEGMVHEIEQDSSFGRWENDYPYWIFSDINVLEGDSLILEPGVEVIFKRRNYFNVYGTLKAEGTEEDSIRISNAGIDFIKWYSLNFFGESSSNSRVCYSEISNNFRGVHFYDASPLISHTLLQGTDQVEFHGNAAPKLSFDIVDLSVIPSIICRDQSTPQFSRSIFNHDIVCVNDSKPKFYHNDFYNFWTAIVVGDNAQPEIIGNIFQRGGYAVDMRYGIAPEIITHNIFFDLYDEIIWAYESGIPGFGILNTVNYNGDSCDVHHNLFMDPMLKYPENGDFSLLNDSPCIDAGYPFYPYDPDSTIADIGAFYFDQTTVSLPYLFVSKPEISIYHYPNPASGFVTFVIEGNRLRNLKLVKIMIYDLAGKKIDEIHCPYLNKSFGKKVVGYDFGRNKSGTYFYTLEANGQILSMNKLIMVK